MVTVLARGICVICQQLISDLSLGLIHYEFRNIILTQEVMSDSFFGIRLIQWTYFFFNIVNIFNCFFFFFLKLLHFFTCLSVCYIPKVILWSYHKTHREEPYPKHSPFLKTKKYLISSNKVITASKMNLLGCNCYLFLKTKLMKMWIYIFTEIISLMIQQFLWPT